MKNPKPEKPLATPWEFEFYYNCWPGGKENSFDLVADDVTHLHCRCDQLIIRGPLFYNDLKIKEAIKAHQCPGGRSLFEIPATFGNPQQND